MNTPAERFETVFEVERREIQRRRNLPQSGEEKSGRDDLESVEPCPPEHLAGLALSGGGVRSATFCLGLLQGLYDAKVLHIFDYLSTVSGGGYVGGWWSAWLSRGRKEGIFPRDEFIEPLREEDYHAADWAEEAQAAETVVAGETVELADAQKSEASFGVKKKNKVAESSITAGTDPIHHLRLFASYLTPRKGLMSADTWRAVTFITRKSGRPSLCPHL